MDIEPSLEAIDLLPVNYFPLEFDCFWSSGGKLTRKHEIPLTSSLLCEEDFARVFLGWNEKGIGGQVKFNRPFEQSVYPDVEYGDSVELFFDTRDIKSAGFNHRFCHHFIFLGEPVDGIQAQEATHFRTEDVHPLCDSKELEVKVSYQRKSYDMSIWIPASCLHGYDPAQFNRIGFTYRINRTGDYSQHFSLQSAEYQIDQNPALWSTMRLVK